LREFLSIFLPERFSISDCFETSNSYLNEIADAVHGLLYFGRGEKTMIRYFLGDYYISDGQKPIEIKVKAPIEWMALEEDSVAMMEMM